MRKRIIIDWIKTIGKCEVCGSENEIHNRFLITNTRLSTPCDKCGKNTMHIVVAHEASLFEERDI